MTDTTELAKRAMKCKAWRWMDGMLSNWGRVMVSWDGNADGALPDLTDPATIGCLLYLVRQGWGDDGAYTKRVYRSGGYVEWICYAPSIRYPAKMAHGESEAECLVAALESMNDD